VLGCFTVLGCFGVLGASGARVRRADVLRSDILRGQ
jgi:hypothetical protein